MRTVYRTMIAVVLFFVQFCVAFSTVKDELCSRAPQIAEQAQHWCSETHYCKWKGILCYADNETIYSISLVNLTLNIELPFDSLATDTLEILQLDNCSINGSLASLPELILAELHLNDNSVSDFLSVRNFATLMAFSAAGNGLTANLPSIACIEHNPLKMRRLDLSRNSLVGDMSECIGPIHMGSLRQLNVSRNALTGWMPVPPSIMWFDVAYNQLTRLEDTTLETVLLRDDSRAPLLGRCNVAGNNFNAPMPLWMHSTVEQNLNETLHCGYTQTID